MASEKRIKKTLAVPVDPPIHDLIMKLAEERDQPVARVVRRFLLVGIAAEGFSVLVDPVKEIDK